MNNIKSDILKKLYELKKSGIDEIKLTELFKSLGIIPYNFEITVELEIDGFLEKRSLDGLCSISKKGLDYVEDYIL